MKRREKKCVTKTAEPYLVYGLSYKTIHDDSSYYDDHEEWFESEEVRDKVYEDWSKDLYWDKGNNCELKYRTPQPNYTHSLTRKISKFSKEEETTVVTYVFSSNEYEEMIAALKREDFNYLENILIPNE